MSNRKSGNLSKKKEKEKVYDAAAELYNKRFENYYDEYQELSVPKKKWSKIKSHKLKGFIYDGWFTEESDGPTVKGDEKELDYLQSMPSLEGGEEEVKEGKGLKILTPNKLLTRLPVLSVQIKAGNNLHRDEISFVSA